MDDQGCYWAEPEFKAAYRPDHRPDRAHGGLWAQQIFVYSRLGEGGILQQVRLLAGARITFTTWVSAWQCMDSDHCSLQAVKQGGSPTDPPPDPARALFLMQQWGCLPLDLEGEGYKRCKFWTASDRPYDMGLQIGIDPTGGTNPQAASVVWGQKTNSFDYWSQAIVTATRATAGTITVFAKCAPRFDFARVNNDCFLDDAELKIESLLGYITYLPAVSRGQ